MSKRNPTRWTTPPIWNLGAGVLIVVAQLVMLPFDPNDHVAHVGFCDGVSVRVSRSFRFVPRSMRSASVRRRT